MEKMKEIMLVRQMISKTGYFRIEMKELRTDAMMEVSMEKLKENLLARKIERMMGEPMAKLTGLMKVTSCGIDDETVGITDG